MYEGPLAEKCTANQPNATSYWWLNRGYISVLLAVLRYILRIKVENCLFRQPYDDYRPLAGARPAFNINLYIAEKYF